MRLAKHQLYRGSYRILGGTAKIGVDKEVKHTPEMFKKDALRLILRHSRGTYRHYKVITHAQNLSSLMSTSMESSTF